MSVFFQAIACKDMGKAIGHIVYPLHLSRLMRKADLIPSGDSPVLTLWGEGCGDPDLCLSNSASSLPWSLWSTI
jgi:hypothetical protein